MHPHPVQRTHVQVERDHRMAVTDQPFHHRSPDATARTRHHIRPRHGVPVCTGSAARSALSYGSGSLHHMNSQMTTGSLLEWLAGYERAWRTQGTVAIGDLFAPDARYSQGPYLDPVVGRPAIARMWEDTRDGPDEVFEMIREVVAIDGDTAVVRLQVRYGVPVTQEYRDLWIMKFAPDGRCTSFEEWPFWPGQPHTAADTP